MRCPWEILSRHSLEWDRCQSGEFKHSGAHRIGNYIVSPEVLEALQGRGDDIIRKVYR